MGRRVESFSAVQVSASCLRIMNGSSISGRHALCNVHKFPWDKDVEADYVERNHGGGVGG